MCSLWINNLLYQVPFLKKTTTMFLQIIDTKESLCRVQFVEIVDITSLCTFRHHGSCGNQFVWTREPQWTSSSRQPGSFHAQCSWYLSYCHGYQPGQCLENTDLARQQGYWVKADLHVVTKSLFSRYLNKTVVTIISWPSLRFVPSMDATVCLGQRLADRKQLLLPGWGVAVRWQRENRRTGRDWGGGLR